jgi:hypothetical protein
MHFACNECAFPTSFFTNIGYLFNVIVELLCVILCTNDLPVATSLSKRLRIFDDSSSQTEQI